MNKENPFKYMSAEQMMSTWNDVVKAYYGTNGVKLCLNDLVIKGINIPPNERPVENKRKTFGYEDLKPGMILVATNGDFLILFPTKRGLAYTNNSQSYYWGDLKYEYADNFGVNPELLVIDLVFDVVDGEYSLMTNEEGEKKKPLWKRQVVKPKIEITKEMIAEKFDVDVEQIELV